MTAKKYLERLKTIDIRIEQKIEELSRLEGIATSMGNLMYGEKVQKSGTGDKVANSVSAIVDLQNEINYEIDAFVKEKHTVINQINSLEDSRYIGILFKCYVEQKDFATIADEMQYVYGHALRIHKAALKQFQREYQMLLDVI